MRCPCQRSCCTGAALRAHVAGLAVASVAGARAAGAGAAQHMIAIWCQNLDLHSVVQQVHTWGMSGLCSQEVVRGCVQHMYYISTDAHLRVSQTGVPCFSYLPQTG